jgi:hypothetical protein
MVYFIKLSTINKRSSSPFPVLGTVRVVYRIEYFGKNYGIFYCFQSALLAVAYASRYGL